MTAPAGEGRRDGGAPIESIGAPPTAVDARAGLEVMRLALRQAATMVVRIGAVLLLLALLVRLLPASGPAGAAVDDMAIVISVLVVLVSGGYLVWTRDLVRRGEAPAAGGGGR